MNEITPKKSKPQSSLLTDFAPVLAYVIVYNIARRMWPDNALYIGAAVFAIAIVIAVIHSKVTTGKVSIILWVSAVIVLGTVAITFIFQNKTIFYMKPTAINLLYGGTILGSLVFGKNVFKKMSTGIYQLPDHAWKTLAIRWGIFFIFMAGLNEFIWRTTSEAFWSNFKLMGTIPITFVFIMLNMPLLMKHMPELSQTPEED